MTKQLLGLCLIAMLAIGCQPNRDLGEQTIEIGTSYAEFAVPYMVDDEVNPFDVIATASFSNQATQENKEALWFYANDSMRVRFAALEAGNWTFTTTSKDDQLNGYLGKVTVQQPTNSSRNGYLIAKRKNGIGM